MLTITDAAATRIAHIGQKQGNPSLRLRIRVDGGGCSGFQYVLDFDDQNQPDDVAFHHPSGVEVVVDKLSLSLMDAATVDYVETLGSAAFEIRNPQATAKCGCGNSFSL